MLANLEELFIFGNWSFFEFCVQPKKRSRKTQEGHQDHKHHSVLTLFYYDPYIYFAAFSKSASGLFPRFFFYYYYEDLWPRVATTTTTEHVYAMGVHHSIAIIHSIG